jgi:hypothetical protein
MQAELDQEGYAGQIEILGLNGIGLESGNAAICSGRTLPWLQDTADANVWASWGVVWRDVWLLDGENKPITVYNLTQNNLAEPIKYAELKALLIGAAAP